METVLDPRTLAFVLMAVTALLSAFMVIVWRTHKVYEGFNLWTIAQLFLTAGFLLLSLQGLIPKFTSIAMADFLIVMSGGLIYAGIRKFRDQPHRDYFNYILIGLTVALILYFLYGRDVLNFRIMAFSICIGIISLRSAITLLLDVPAGLRTSFWFTGSIMLFFGTVSILRSIYVYVYDPPGNFFDANPISGLYFLSFMLAAMGAIFGFFMMTSQRLELELKTARDELRHLATTDYLTDVFNRRYFFEAGRQEFKRARRYKHPLSVLILDIDYFKNVNDTHGHITGDRMLIAIAMAARSNLRAMDVLARIGGEEFAVILPETDGEMGLEVAERLRRSISEVVIYADGAPVSVTVSIGASMLLAEDSELGSIMERADAALYEAKQNGRNRVAIRKDALQPELSKQLEAENSAN